MQYALLLYASEVEAQRMSAAEAAALQRGREAFAAELEACGMQRASHTLAPAATATTVRLRGGKALLCDAPFAETQEPLLGLLLIEARDLDEAIAIAQRAPEAWLGAVEIRPLRERR
jgi:hypothetical protein